MRLSTLLTMTSQLISRCRKSEARTESPVVCAIAIPHYGNRRYLRGYLAAMVNKLVAQAIETGVKSLEVRPRPGLTFRTHVPDPDDESLLMH